MSKTVRVAIASMALFVCFASLGCSDKDNAVIDVTDGPTTTSTAQDMDDYEAAQMAAQQQR